MPWDLLIRGGHVISPFCDGVLDIAIEGGQIVDMAAEIVGSAREEIDATGLHVMPGVIDPHVHFNEPGRTGWEGWATGSSALAAGGGVACFDMPLNSDPPVLNAATFHAKRQAAEASSIVDFGLWGGLTPGNIDRIDELADAGVVGLKAFMSNSGIAEFGRADDATLRRGMEAAVRRQLIVAVHAEDETITSKLARAAKGRTWADYLASRPVEVELEAVRRVLDLAEEACCTLHIVHVSHPKVLDLIDAAVERGVSVTAETCPHYWLLCDEDLPRLGAAAKCAPPLRSRDAMKAMAEALAGGRITFVGSDHSPAPASMKTGDDAFAIWGGISGVQSTLTATLSLAEMTSPHHVAALTATQVAITFNLPSKGRVEVGYDADIALVDLAASFTLTREMLLDRHKLSPYIGRTFKGRVLRTIRRGETICSDGRVTAKGGGRLIVPQR